MKPRMSAVLNDQQGAALVLALLVLTVLTLFSITAIMASTQGLKISNKYKVEQQAVFSADGGADYIAGFLERAIGNGKTVSTEDLTSSNVSVDTTDSDGDGITDLEGEINGGNKQNTDAVGESASGTPNVTLTVLGDVVEVDLDFLSSKLIAGASSEFAARYEGIGSGTAGGVALLYQVEAYTNVKETPVTVRAIYKCVEGGGRCL